MDRTRQQVIRTGTPVAARRGTALAALLLMSVSGCIGDGQQFFMPDLPTGTQPRVAKVAARWDNGIVVGVDNVNRGAPMYGISGHVYLFSEGLKENLIAEGDLVCEMWGVIPEHAQNGPECLQVWHLKKDVLNREYHQDGGSFGPGYALSLPWPGYRPDIAQAQMRLRYEPAKGLPLYDMSMIALVTGREPKAQFTRRMETGAGQPIVNGPQTAPWQQQPGMVQPAGYQQQAGMVQPAGYQQQPGMVQPPTYQQQPMPPQQFAPQVQPGAAYQQQPVSPYTPSSNGYQQSGAVAPSVPPQSVPPPWATQAPPAYQQPAAVTPTGEVSLYPVPPPQAPPIREPMSRMPQYADPPPFAPPSYSGGMQALRIGRHAWPLAA